MPTGIKQALEEIKDLSARIDLIESDKVLAINELVPPETRAIIEGIERDAASDTAEVQEVLDVLIKHTKAAIINSGESAKIDGVRATYVKPRTSWDSKILKALAVNAPEINQAIKTGKPSARIKIL